MSDMELIIDYKNVILYFQEYLKYSKLLIEKLEVKIVKYIYI